MNEEPDDSANQRPVDAYELKIPPDCGLDALRGLRGIPGPDRITDQAGNRLAVFIDQGHAGFHQPTVESGLHFRVPIQLIGETPDQTPDLGAKPRIGTLQILLQAGCEVGPQPKQVLLQV